MDYQETIDLKRAKTRCWGIWLSHFFLAPVASAVYSAKTNNWLPFGVATGVAVVGLPLAIIDLGITTAIAAPITSAAMLSKDMKHAARKIFLQKGRAQTVQRTVRVTVQEVAQLLDLCP